MFRHANRNVSILEYRYAFQKQSDQVHCVLPFDLPRGSQVLFELLKLRHDVAVIGLIDQLGEENISLRQQFLGYWCSGLYERRIKALQNIGIGFEGKNHELLQFPITFLGFRVLQLLGHTVQRPFQFRWGQINTAPIDI